MTGRIVKRLLGCILCVIIIVCGLPACGGEVIYASTYYDAFDTVLVVHVPAGSRADAEDVAEDVHELVLSLHREFDIYHTYEGTHNLKTLNDRAGDGTPVSLSEDVLSLLTLGKEMYAASDGKVNICMGAVLSLWHDARAERTELPSDEALLAAAAHISPDSLVIDREAGTAYLTDPLSSVDVGAIAKGYVADRVLAYAKEKGVDSLLFDLGGHVLAIGCKPDGSAWTVQVRDPEDGGAYTTLEVTDASVVTSGVDQRYFEVDGARYHHLIDPDTLYPAVYHRSATVIVPLAYTAQADGLSTAIFLTPRDTGDRLLQAYDGVEAIRIP